MKTKNDWKGYEELIHKIYKELEPIADVKLNDFILGIDTQTYRQIDVSIRSKIAGHEILIVIQAKNHKKKPDIKIVGEFSSVIKDVQASKGIMICNAGFTNKAKVYAEKLKIDLCSAHDAQIKDWQTEIQIPVIKNSIKVKIKVQHYYLPIGPTPPEEIDSSFPDVALKIFVEKWDKDEISKLPGIHYLPLERETIKVHKNSMPFKTGIEYTIIHRYHLKIFTPIDYRGIKDAITEKFTPSFMAFNEEIPFLNDGTWKFIEDPKQVSVKSSHLDIEMIEIDFYKKKMIRFKWEEDK